ncbi:Alpha/Beta hydrolase protein [Crepidotus variabilis]|uniref:Alpha/Beta hydrolase protein n=1 Tax=Crepidotus variabilis TaxID=179855 RepID=A0A9P6E7J8_9AGAR|nr:Alpha/Beta hydrolase protein [Crepidotus variabilis]
MAPFIYAPVILAVYFASHFATSTSVPVVTGELDFKIPTLNTTGKTWYKIIGNLTSHQRPLVALHGGPGFDSEYMEILSNITTPRSGALVVYDQIGNGRSTHLPNKLGDDSFWTDGLFLSELDNVLSKLGIQDNYDLAGHSWGGMLAARHATSRPKGLKRLVLMSAPASIDLWVGAGNVYLKELPQNDQDIIISNEKAGTTNNTDYQKAITYYNTLHVCSIQPMPEPIAAGFAVMSSDPTVRRSMYGPLNFQVTGSLKGWTIIHDAHKISVPTLVTHGKRDQANQTAVEPLLKEIPNVQGVEFENSGHMAHFEEAAKFTRVVSKFLSEA